MAFSHHLSLSNSTTSSFPVVGMSGPSRLSLNFILNKPEGDEIRTTSTAPSASPPSSPCTVSSSPSSTSAGTTTSASPSSPKEKSRDILPREPRPEEERGDVSEESSGSSSHPGEESDDEEEDEEAEKTRITLNPESVIQRLDQFYTTDRAMAGKQARGTVKFTYIDPVVREIIATFPLHGRAETKREVKKRGMKATAAQIETALKTRAFCIRRLKNSAVKRGIDKKKASMTDELRKENKTLKAKLKALKAHTKKHKCFVESMF